MKDVLDGIDSPADLKELTQQQREQLATDIRKFIISKVSKTGGHLASNLGVVEIAIAVHTVFDAPEDPIIWDTGHQAYPHKILTGRKDQFNTLRQLGGISGFPKRDESPYDCWGVGHGGTGLSAAMGFAVARDQRNEKHQVVCITGDAALEEGLAWEGLHNIGHVKPNLIIVLNDNGMSIAPSIGAVENYLATIRSVSADLLRRARSEPHYLKLKEAAEQFLARTAPGRVMLEAVEHFKKSIKEWIIPPGMVFEELGYAFLGPVDGHNCEKLIECLAEAKTIGGPVIVHAHTTKGKGYEPAERDPWRRHTTVPFDPETGEHVGASERQSYTSIFSKTLIHLAEQDERIVAITAAMPDGTGLDKFAERFPNRCYDVGMAEQHAIAFAASLAFGGMKPVATLYSTFLQRAFDQIIHDVCLQNAPVVMCIDRAGLVGEDGDTHHGIFDIAYLRLIPNLVLMSPKDENELQHMLFTALNHDAPIALRYPRGSGMDMPLDHQLQALEIGKGELLQNGDELAVIAFGNSVHPSWQAARQLEEDGHSIAVINARYAKPLDADLILEVAGRTRNVVAVEEAVPCGGFSSGVLELLHDNGLHNVTTQRITIPDTFIEHGRTQLLREKHGLDANSIALRLRKHLHS